MRGKGDCKVRFSLQRRKPGSSWEMLSVYKTRDAAWAAMVDQVRKSQDGEYRVLDSLS